MFDIIYFEEVDSTMDIIKQYPLNTIVVAKKQTKGRGKNNRFWDSEESSNLYMSIKIQDLDNNSFNYVFLSSLAILKTLKHFFKNINVNLKWPNDVLVNEKKISGILIERDIKEKTLIIGIGVNIDYFPNNVLFLATSLKHEGFIIEKEDFLNIFLKFFCELSYNMDFSKIIEEWSKYAYNIKKNISIKIGEDEKITGIFESVDINGNLILNSKGILRKIFTGDIF